MFNLSVLRRRVPYPKATHLTILERWMISIFLILKMTFKVKCLGCIHPYQVLYNPDQTERQPNRVLRMSFKQPRCSKEKLELKKQRLHYLMIDVKHISITICKSVSKIQVM